MIMGYSQYLTPFYEKLDLDKNLIVVEKSFFRPNEIGEIYGSNLKAQELLNWKYNLSFFNVLDMLIDEENNV